MMNFFATFQAFLALKCGKKIVSICGTRRNEKETPQLVSNEYFGRSERSFVDFSEADFFRGYGLMDRVKYTLQIHTILLCDQLSGIAITISRRANSSRPLRQRYAGTRFEEQRQLHRPQKHKSTVQDSALRVEMLNLEEQADNAKARELY